MTNLTQDKLKSLLDYNKNTGVFIWKIAESKRIKIGQVAGGINSCDYVAIKICNQTYLAHRLVFLYEFGEMPADQIDHVNRVRNDNRLCNLRQCTSSQNRVNSTKRRDNKSGYKGVHWFKTGQKWRSVIKSEHIGLFSSKDEAALAYNERAKELFGEYAHLNKIPG